MEAQFTCNRCNALLTIATADLGKYVVCPSCQATFFVEEAPRSVNAGEKRPKLAVRPPQPVVDQPSAVAEPAPVATQQSVPSLFGCGALFGFGGIFTLLIIAIVVFALNRVSNREWVQYRGDGFRIDFPRQPKQEPVQQLDEGKLNTIALAFRERSWFVSYIDVQKNGAKDVADKWLEQAVQGMTQQGGDVKTRPTTLGDHPGREVLLRNQAGTTLARIFYVDGRIYRLSVTGSRLRSRDASAVKFFNSFQLLN